MKNDDVKFIRVYNCCFRLIGRIFNEKINVFRGNTLYTIREPEPYKEVSFVNIRLSKSMFSTITSYDNYTLSVIKQKQWDDAYNKKTKVVKFISPDGKYIFAEVFVYKKFCPNSIYPYVCKIKAFLSPNENSKIRTAVYDKFDTIPCCYFEQWV